MAKIGKVLANIVLGDIGGNYDILRWSFFSLWPRVVGYPPIFFTDHGYQCSKYVEFHGT